MAVKTHDDVVQSHPPQANGAAGGFDALPHFDALPQGQERSNENTKWQTSKQGDEPSNENTKRQTSKGGDYASNGKVDPPSTKQLSSFQRKYMRRLVANFERAKASVDAAQNAANDFIVACSEEVGIQVGTDGWTFDVDSLEFVRVPQAHAGEEN